MESARSLWDVIHREQKKKIEILDIGQDSQDAEYALGR